MKHWLLRLGAVVCAVWCMAIAAEGLAGARSLMNMRSDLAVILGISLVLVVAAFVAIAMTVERRIWRAIAPKDETR